MGNSSVIPWITPIPINFNICIFYSYSEIFNIMIILDRMIVKDYFKIVVSFLLTFVFCCFLPQKSFAAEPSFSFYPAGGVVQDEEKGFTVDVIINTGGEKIVSAKFVALFDPTVLRLTKAERNRTFFVNWPDDESTLDNDNGVIMLSGFTQSGNGELYSSSPEGDVIARLTFSVLRSKTTYLDWEYETNNGIFETKMEKDGSPPQNILKNKPTAIVLQMAGGGSGLDPSTVKTGVFDGPKYLLIVGAILILFGGFMIFTRPNVYRRGKHTVVVYDNEKE